MDNLRLKKYKRIEKKEIDGNIIKNVLQTFLEIFLKSDSYLHQKIVLIASLKAL